MLQCGAVPCMALLDFPSQLGGIPHRMSPFFFSDFSREHAIEGIRYAVTALSRRICRHLRNGADGRPTIDCALKVGCCLREVFAGLAS